jgi:peptidoglycan/LPS O-acetylase OafA/YrhL
MLSALSQRLLARFYRVTSPGRTYLPQLDGLRFVAIAWVFAYHVVMIVLQKTGQSWDASRSNPLIYSFTAGHVGVDLFFVISGFILALPFAKQHLAAGNPVRLKAYFLRRLTRLEPPYIVHLLATFALWALLRAFLFPVQSDSHPDCLHTVPAHLLTSLFYSHQFIYQSVPLPNVVLWSLEIEVQFYILAPVLALVFTIGSPAGRRTVIVAGMLAFSLAAFQGRDVFLVSHSLAGKLQEFLAGFLLADLYVTRWQSQPPGYRWDLLSALGWAGILFGDRLDSLQILLLPWLIALAYVAAFRGIVLLRVLSNAWIAAIGGMCYTIYMYHGWLIMSLAGVTLRWRTGVTWLDVAIQFGILSVIALIVCSFLFLLFERPFMKPDWHKRAWAALFPPRRLSDEKGS